MNDLKPAVLSALSSLPACAVLSFAREEQPLPIITVNDESVSVYAQADGLPYLEEHVLSLRVYAAAQQEVEALAQAADAAMTALGLRLTLTQDAFDETAYAWCRQLRYRCLTHQDSIYQ
ncbi:MAG: hypothetical protein IJ662_09310 [Clostridia bacterium]|nr:hypothetical protein [Clostridia bacterium]